MIEKFVGRLKVQEERLHGYEDNQEEKYILFTHEEWLAWTKKNDAADSSFSGMRGRGSHTKEIRGRGCGSKHENTS